MSDARFNVVKWAVIPWPPELQGEITEVVEDLPPMQITYRRGLRQVGWWDVIGIALQVWYSDELDHETYTFLWQHHCEREEGFEDFALALIAAVKWVLTIAEPFFDLLTPRHYYPFAVAAEALVVGHYE